MNSLRASGACDPLTSSSTMKQWRIVVDANEKIDRKMEARR